MLLLFGKMNFSEDAFDSYIISFFKLNCRKWLLYGQPIKNRVASRKFAAYFQITFCSGFYKYGIFQNLLFPLSENFILGFF